MQMNMGQVDRGARLVVGVLLVAFALGLFGPNTGWNWIGWIGVVPIVTALIGSCPLYTVLGVSTCPVKRA